MFDAVFIGMLYGHGARGHIDEIFPNSDIIYFAV